MDKRGGKDLRIGDPEREHAMKLLGEHLAVGRLDVHEYDERCAKVAAARFRSDLLAPFEDLPSPRPDDRAPDDRAQPERTQRRLPLAISAFPLGVCAILLLLVIMTRQIALLPLIAVFAVLWFNRRG